MHQEIRPTTALPDVAVIERRSRLDERGSFETVFDRDTFARLGFVGPVTEAYYSESRQGVLRGLHFQRPPHEQAKITQCIRGEILDVLVDVRADSRTFGKHVSMTLSAENRRAVFAPRGFAHGFYVAKGPASVLYLVDGRYDLSSEVGIHWDDPDLGIPWPAGVTPILSQKDAALPSLRGLQERQRKEKGAKA